MVISINFVLEFIFLMFFSMDEWFKNCPYCWESIKWWANKCRFCWEFLTRKDESINKNLNWSDRMRRGIYFRNNAILFVWLFLIWLIIWFLKANNWLSEDDINVFFIVLWLVNIWISILWSIKRCHDIWWSWWLSVLTIVPFVSWIMYILLFFTPWTDWENKYGPKPD